MPARPKTATLMMRMMLAQRTGRELAEEERPSGVEHVTETSRAIFAQSLAPALRAAAHAQRVPRARLARGALARARRGPRPHAVDGAKIGDCCARSDALQPPLRARRTTLSRPAEPVPALPPRRPGGVAARAPASSPPDYMTSEYCLATRHTVQPEPAPRHRRRPLPQPFAPGPDLRDGSSASTAPPSLARSQGDDGGFLSLARSQGDDGPVHPALDERRWLPVAAASEAPAGDGDDERTRLGRVAGAPRGARRRLEQAAEPPAADPSCRRQRSSRRCRDDASVPRGDASAASAAAPAPAAARDDASVASGSAERRAAALTPERRPSWDASRSPPARRTRILSTRARVVVVVSPSATRGRASGAAATTRTASDGLGALGRERRGPKPAWEKSHGKGHAEPMRVDIAGPASQYGASPRGRRTGPTPRSAGAACAATSGTRSGGRPSRPTTQGLRRAAGRRAGDIVHGAAPAPGQHPSQFGFSTAAGDRTYEVSIRSTSGAASRSYVLVQPSTPRLRCDGARVPLRHARPVRAARAPTLLVHGHGRVKRSPA
ncbi:hypothetical protein JL721_12030 [Aureococcus anophagefferens]|nr:hypothetical protein JL721_12030 [Aureococcus anophagefferens]